MISDSRTYLIGAQILDLLWNLAPATAVSTFTLRTSYSTRSTWRRFLRAAITHDLARYYVMDIKGSFPWYSVSRSGLFEAISHAGCYVVNTTTYFLDIECCCYGGLPASRELTCDICWVNTPAVSNRRRFRHLCRRLFTVQSPSRLNPESRAYCVVSLIKFVFFQFFSTYSEIP